MPTYQYACTACGERSEVVQSFTDAPLTECSVCGGALRKVFSAVGVVFKGSGFYKTDSRAAAKSSSGKDGKGSGDTGSGGGKSETSAPAASSGSGDKGSGSADKSSSTPAATSTSSSATPASKSA